MKNRDKENAFTLVELMIVVAIIGIIVAFGYPAYRDQVIKARRADGMAFLLDIADREERFYADRATYTTTITDLGYADANSPEGGYYSASISDDPADDLTITFTITVTPQNGQDADTKCGAFTLTSLGAKSVGGTSSVVDCWK
ncbi:MAG: prepilin-type N-terminal cleavage/methylation domain-containing protein [Gammaproteobacteria bacterium]|nr:prepilin-type N-terminal cleavage/methylation domain-containing protein [Gammaproteobacteria bacterium]